MLLAFSTKNFRSIREEACLSLVAGSGKEHDATHVFRPTLPPGIKPMRLLRSAALYGPNAGGKSNLIKALRTMQRIVLHSNKDMDNLPVVPFRFSEQTADAPSMFEVVILVDGVRYQYGFSATQKQIHAEWLFAFPKGRAQTWFRRELNTDIDESEYTFGANLIGNKEIWKDLTRSNALFLSTAVQLNSQKFLPVYQWFSDKLHICKEGWSREFSVKCCQDDRKNKILDFLKAADFAISDIYADEIELKTLHQSDSENIEIDFSDESGGTQKMFCLAGPWIDALDKGRVLFIDELQTNLHPALVRFLVNLFHSEVKNQPDAQLVFSTHETNILNQDIFRRDQIWFCERSDTQGTRLFPLTDFSPRKKTENLEQAYLSGRYGALPYVRNIARSFESS